MRPTSIAVVAPLAVMLLAGPAAAVSGTDPGVSNPVASDDPYVAGVAAFEQEEWQAVLDHMSAALEARPWEDNAHNLMGFAYRKLGDYPAALESYRKALLLNPHNRGALEYLGEAYLELDRPDDTQAVLIRLADACKRIADGPDDAWQAECEEWQELDAAYEAYVAERRSARAK